MFSFNDDEIIMSRFFYPLLTCFLITVSCASWATEYKTISKLSINLSKEFAELAALQIKNACRNTLSNDARLMTEAGGYFRVHLKKKGKNEVVKVLDSRNTINTGLCNQATKIDGAFAKASNVYNMIG